MSTIALPAADSATTWTLFLGIHRGTLTSRDSEQPRPLPSLEACRAEAESAARAYHARGMQI